MRLLIVQIALMSAVLVPMFIVHATCKLELSGRGIRLIDLVKIQINNMLMLGVRLNGQKGLM